MTNCNFPHLNMSNYTVNDDITAPFRNGPPGSPYHVREWTFHEFQLYLQSQGFRVLKSFDGVQNPTTQVHAAVLA